MRSRCGCDHRSGLGIHHQAAPLPTNVAVTLQEADGRAFLCGRVISTQGWSMSKAIQTASLGLVLTVMALGVSPGLAQPLEEVKVVFE